MQIAAEDFDRLLKEHATLLRAYGEAQARCSEQIRRQALEIARLEGQAIRLRAELVKRDTALAWAREEHAALERSIPGLPRRVALARHVEALQARVRDLMDAQHCHESRHESRHELRHEPHQAPPGGAPLPQPPHGGDIGDLEADLAAADLVICQTGCISHGAYWRVQDHCKRTGKACVLVEKADALHIVRIDRSGAALVASRQA